MKIDRMMGIVMLLLERKKISASKLAEIFEVSIRTIYRDIQSLEMSGIPLITYPGINGGIELDENYILDKKIFTEENLISLIAGLQTIAPIMSGKEIEVTLAKLKGFISLKNQQLFEKNMNAIIIDMSSWRNKDFQLEKFESIKLALKNEKIIDFCYLDKQMKESSREVEPYRLIWKNGSWYVQGFCLLKNDFRIFKLSRILKLKITEKSYDAREGIPEAFKDNQWIKEKLEVIQLIVDESLLDKILEWCEKDNIFQHGKNKYLVNFPITLDEEGYNLLLSFGDKAYCISPENVREELKKRIQSMINQYN